MSKRKQTAATIQQAETQPTASLSVESTQDESTPKAPEQPEQEQLPVEPVVEVKVKRTIVHLTVEEQASKLRAKIAALEAKAALQATVAGKTGRWNVAGVLVDVVVEAMADHVFGQAMLLIRPVSGIGVAKVAAKLVELDK